MVMMLMALFLIAVLFLFGFISSSAAAAAADDVQTVRAWLTSSLFSTQKVKLSQSSQPLQTPTVTTQLNINKNKIMNDDELKSVFKTFDKNSDGYITKLELREAMKGAGMAMEESQIDEMVENMDENGDGLIDLIEFCASFPQDDVEDDDVGLREAFDVFDGNKDGVISGEELRMVLVSLGLKQGLKVRDCEEMIRKVDVDGDGMIDFSEFKKMMRNGGTLFASSTSFS